LLFSCRRFRPRTAQNDSRRAKVETPPGSKGVRFKVGIAGHRTTYGAPFRRIDETERGDEIVVEMPYARFVYRFERSRIVDPSQVDVVRDVERDRLVLTACHPLYSAAERYVVFARQVEVHRP